MNCEEGVWSKPIPNVQQETDPLLINVEKNLKVEQDSEGQKSLYMSLFTLIISIPALIGAWCWPALVVGLITGTVSAAAREMGHWISLAITGCMMVFVIAYLWYTLKRRSRKRGFWHKYGPLICCMIAAPLVLADTTRHVLQDKGIWKECDRTKGEIWGPQCLWSSSQYHCTLKSPHCLPTRQENLSHLSVMGIIFTILFTYIGFFFLFVGTMWNANLLTKLRQIRDKWHQLRQHRK